MGRHFVLGKSAGHGVRNLLLGALCRANTTQHPFAPGPIVLFNDPRRIARDDGMEKCYASPPNSLPPRNVVR